MTTKTTYSVHYEEDGETHDWDFAFEHDTAAEAINHGIAELWGEPEEGDTDDSGEIIIRRHIRKA